ncbi:MAG: hypothetical protein Q4G51_10450 [Dermatophilus congolensis]|nr:hypothetical protein [Dermatophilus congolensis]
MPRKLARMVDASIGKKPAKPVDPALLAAGSVRPEPPTEAVRVWVAPANFAGQGKAWAESLNQHVDGVGARSMAVEGAIRFTVDQEVHPDVYRDVGWQQDQEQYVFENYTHVLIEAERPVFGTRYGSTCEVEISRLRDAGLTVGLISHGSDLRIPSRHAELFPHSPFDDPDDNTTKVLEARARQNARIIDEFDGPVFVSTPDLLDYAPEARWCPTVVDTSEWASAWPLLARRVPRVVHIPSNGKLKGSEYIDEIMGALAAEGLVDYERLSGVTRDDIRREFGEADIVIDQLVMGLYGVTAIEALAAGRVVVAFLGDAVRERIRDAAGVEVPIKEATVETLREVILDIVGDREAAREFAAAGPDYATQVHDGRMSAQVLTELTGGTVVEGETDAEETLATIEAARAGVAAPKPVPDLDAPVRLFVGPANFAGQGTAWARAAQANLDGVSARAMAARQPTLRFETDYEIDPHVFTLPEWGERQERYLAEFYTHVLIEAMRPVTGYRRGVRASDEIPALEEAGLNVALIAHGTDVRVPSVHRASTKWSPFDSDWDAVPTVDVLEQRAQRNVDSMAAFDGPTFVSTPDLLDYVPDARWCPVVIDPARWAASGGVAAGEGVGEGRLPVVVHVPSHSRLKGTHLIDDAVSELAASGVIDYRRRSGVDPAEMPAVYGEADVVLDQFALGSYGVAACEAMAAGRVVVGHVTDAVRTRVRDETGLELPIVECEPDAIADCLRGLVTDPDNMREIARRSVEFVTAVHDGRRAAQTLACWLKG